MSYNRAFYGIFESFQNLKLQWEAERISSFQWVFKVRVTFCTHYFKTSLNELILYIKNQIPKIPIFHSTFEVSLIDHWNFPQLPPSWPTLLFSIDH